MFPDYKPDGSLNGEPQARSGASGDVIHFARASQQIFFGIGFQYFCIPRSCESYQCRGRPKRERELSAPLQASSRFQANVTRWCG